MSIVDRDEPDIDQFLFNGLRAQVAVHIIVFVVLEVTETANYKSCRHEELNQGQSLNLQTVQCACVVGWVYLLQHLEDDDNKENYANLVALIVVSQNVDH